MTQHINMDDAGWGNVHCAQNEEEIFVGNWVLDIQ